MRLETVVVVRQGQKVRVNKTDLAEGEKYSKDEYSAFENVAHVTDAKAKPRQK